MKLQIVLCLCFVCSSLVYAQEKTNAFKLLIITPDSARVEADLMPQFESIELAMQKELQRISNTNSNSTKGNQRTTQGKSNWQSEAAAYYSEKHKNIKFYQLISKFASMYIAGKTGQGRNSIGEVTLDTGSKRKLYDSLPPDKTWQYLLHYGALHAEKIGDEIRFLGTITLIETERERVILERDFIGSSFNEKPYLPCKSPAECAMYDFIAISSEAIIAAISN
jgi:hypothetical protein